LNSTRFRVTRPPDVMAVRYSSVAQAEVQAALGKVVSLAGYRGLLGKTGGGGSEVVGKAITSRHGTQETGVAPAGSALATRTVGGTTIIEARIPRANLGQGFGWTGGITTGFSPSLGSVLGLRIWYARFGGVGDLFSPPWATVNEYYHFDDVVLR
jgi:hypothetical protein